MLVWPELPYNEFKSTAHLLHMTTQVIGKLKLATPFEPHWANVPLWITSEGVTSGPIPYELGTFSIDMNLINHQIVCVTSQGKKAQVSLKSTSVAQLTHDLIDALRSLGIRVNINLVPQEIPNPIPFEKDTEHRNYNESLAHAWWCILSNTYCVMQRYHARFLGITPPVGLMWGTFDIRDARYINVPVPTTGENAGYLRRNAMDVAQIEAGWWPGDSRYERPAFYSFTYPQPPGIETAQLQVQGAYWSKELSEFVLDYDELRKHKNAEKLLLDFFDNTYAIGAMLAKWDRTLIGSGNPI